jgi:uncharacterized protein
MYKASLKYFLKFLFLSICVISLTACAEFDHLSRIGFGKGVERPAISETHHVVLLLPLSSPALGASSKAINNGFLAAFYARQEQQRDINVKVMDTGNKDVVAVYNQAVASGADVIVGPLTKQEVQSIAAFGGRVLPKPTIALNTLDTYQDRPVVNLYQFGLSPQDEAAQAAAKMVQDGYSNIALLSPNNAWGNKIASAFIGQLKSSGGKVVAALNYTKGKDLDLQIRDFLNITEEQIKLSHKNKTPLVPRNDFNAVFVIAQPQEASQVIPLLKFYYTDSIALYSISALYAGFPRPANDQDLNGVVFCDMPWVLLNASELPGNLQNVRAKVSAMWPDAFSSNARLYALGIDAFNLAVSLSEVLSSPSAGVYGASGKLYLDGYNHIYRELQWVKMQQGVPQP